MNWIKISEEGYPADQSRVLVWNKSFNEAQILVYNGYCECWDDESGDDFYDHLNTDIYPAYIKIEPYYE